MSSFNVKIETYVYFDLETTGLGKSDKITEMSAVAISARDLSDISDDLLDFKSEFIAPINEDEFYEFYYKLERIAPRVINKVCLVFC